MNAARPVLSVLDLVPASAGRTRADALREMVDLARAADDAGYARYWLAKHFLLLKTITESIALRICLDSSDCNFIYCNSVISPSKTDFCMCVRYFLHILNMLRAALTPPSLISISYTKMQYIYYHHQILNPSYPRVRTSVS